MLAASLTLRDAGELAIWVAGVATALGVIARRPVRWLWRNNVSDPATDKLRSVVAEVVAEELDARPWTNGESAAAISEIRDELAELRRCVARLTPPEQS